jgi:uncharacterized protein YrzB (UPF0473 family)
MDNNVEEDEIITMLDDEGNEVSFVVADSIEHNGVNYILVLEMEAYDDENEEADAMVLKVVSEKGSDVLYEEIENDDEFDIVVQLFRRDNDDYEIKL